MLHARPLLCYWLLPILAALSACGSDSGSSGGAAPPPSSQARDDMVVTAQGQSTTITVESLLDNDSESGGGPLSLDSFTSPDNGTLEEVDTESALKYTPDDNATSDSFSYTAGNNRGSSTATVRIVLEENFDDGGACTSMQSDKEAAGQRYCIETIFKTPSHVPDNPATARDESAPIDIALQLFVPNRDALRANAAAISGESLPADAPGFSPLLIQGHGYGSNKLENLDEESIDVSEQVIFDAWKHGYWVISFTQRGFADSEHDPDRSGGQIGLMSPALEGLDFARLVDWAICHIRDEFGGDAGFVAAHGTQTDFDPDMSNCVVDHGDSLLADDNGTALVSVDGDVALGTIGYSYGGGFQLNAQSVDPRVDAMIPMDTWFDLRYSLHPNDTPKTTWVDILTGFTLNGGNENPPPTFIAEGNLQINGANNDPNDEPYNKARQVSIPLLNQLGPNGPIAYCDGNASQYASRTGDSDGEPVDFPDPLPIHTTDQRGARADMLMIQGLGDTLFNFNEGFDIARCFAEQNSSLDVRFIAQLSGHPLPPPLGPSHYGAPDPNSGDPTAGTNGSFYLDEVIHCGRDANDHPQRYNLREVGRAWFDDKLRGVVDVDDFFPHRVCMTQPNNDPGLVLDTDDEFLHIENTGPNAHKFPIEGIVGADLGDIPIGSETMFANFEDARVTTGTAVSEDALTAFIDQSTFVELKGGLNPIGSSRVMAGIPLIELEIVDRQNPLTDEIFYVGVAVKRCCEDDPAPELIQFQATPVRIVPPPAAVELIDFPLVFPKPDPRNNIGGLTGEDPADEPHFYAITWGDNPGAGGLTLKGRLPGISTRLDPGDIVGLLFMPEHPAFKTMTSIPEGPSSVTVSGSIELPILPPTTNPSDLQDFSPGYITSPPP